MLRLPGWRATLLGSAALALLLPAAPVPAQPVTPSAVTAPEMQAVLEAWQALGARPVEQLDVAQARQMPGPSDVARHMMREGNLRAPAVMRGVRSRDMQVPGAEGMIPARLYLPGGQAGSAMGGFPLILYWPGGFWVANGLVSHDLTPRALAGLSGSAVLALGHRLAPEHPFPAARDDALAAWRWVTAHARDFAADPERIILAGEGSGANLALHVALTARSETRAFPPRHVLAAYPIAGVDGATESHASGAVEGQDSRGNLPATPGMGGMPPVTVILAEADPMRPEGEALAARLREAGVDAEARIFPGTVHGFMGLAPVLAVAREAQDYAVERMRPVLDLGRGSPPAPLGAGGGIRGSSTPVAAGRLLLDLRGLDAGTVEEVVVDAEGQPLGAVVSWGGLAGRGMRRALVPVEQIDAEGDRPRLLFTREELEAMPRFERGRLEEAARDQGWAGNVSTVRR
ncbi:alpha/beta hydrolase [Sabulicella glaciei]|uniref:Alpha/beta hydrolase n=1 Tax=Sabulicella glaciei TaxID=2984948 RepID=A0ABT3P0Q5_9PROT|nr:alpha/beta hydrolase [Roseococcus sp. MDT2-1-1]MCW8087986.1 alpha/beta hydrolase [Roseococcus sp. MDT2-1-1]